MTDDRIIYEACSQRQESQTNYVLSEQFFNNLHQIEMRYVRLKHSKKTKEIQTEMIQVILSLVSAYTDCIDYFGSIAENVVVYYQAKIKDINKYFQFFRNVSVTLPVSVTKNQSVQYETIKDLGSISEQTSTELLPEEQREPSIVGKQALNQNLMACLRNQDISSHIKEKMKKDQKMLNKIQDSIKQQQQKLNRRMNKRKLAKSRVSQSFSQPALNLSQFNKSIQQVASQNQTTDMIQIDLEALDCDIDSPQKLKEYISSRHGLNIIKREQLANQQQISINEEDDS